MTDHYDDSSFEWGPEEKLLGGLLLDREYADAWFAPVAKIVGADDFLNPGHRMVFQAMQRLADKAQPITLESVKQEMADAGTLAKVSEDFVDLLIPLASNLVFYAQIIRETAATRRLAKACAEIGALGAGWHGTGAELAAEADRRLQAARGAA